MNRKSPLYVLGFMAAICLVFGSGIAIVNYATQKPLAKNAAKHRNRVLCRAFMLDVRGNSAEAYQAAVETHLTTATVGAATEPRLVYRCTMPGREAIGFLFSGIGFWDRIEGVLVLTPDLRQVLNVQFLDHKETPGLGARIEEPGFTDQFKGLVLAWDNPQGQRLIIGAAPDPQARNRVDGITGATQTTMALMRCLNEELARIRAAMPPPAATP